MKYQQIDQKPQVHLLLPAECRGSPNCKQKQVLNEVLNFVVEKIRRGLRKFAVRRACNCFSQVFRVVEVAR